MTITFAGVFLLRENIKMALYGSQQRNLVWYMFGIFLIVTEICNNHLARTAVAAYMYGINKVDVCPQNQTEWEKASRKLNCSDDSKNPLNRYHCLSVHDLSTLVEFCYNQTRPRVVKGLCMIYVQEKNILDGYNCTTFDDGCPDMFYQSDETYKFPRCMEIDPYNRCYIADSSCRSNKTSSADETIAMETTDVTFFSRANKTLASNSNNTDNKITIIIPTSVVLVLGVICIVVAVIIKKRKVNCLQCKGYLDVCDTVKNREDAEMPLLTLDEAKIKRMGFEYLLEELPTDQESILEIANILKVPLEILSWSKDNRQQYLRSVNKGTISVYSGRGMVIGCAKAGKTTLVKKLKGEKNITTTSTIGIEIHVHEFKLDAEECEECTIISCMENEKNKGCLCITPAAGDHKRKVNIVNNEQSQADSEETIPKTILQTYEKTMNIGENTSSALVEKSVFSPTLEDATSNADTLTNNRRNYIDVNNSDENKFWQQWDFSNCVASANEDNLKVLSLLDFAGQSAYYACHHIFFSPRAFYILVVDMSKNLKSRADKACDKEGLIYSNWTYADYISYWLGSIHTYSSKSAPVILVLSHSEGIGAAPDNMILLKYFFEICGTLPIRLRKHLDTTRVFSVEIGSDKNMINLKKCIASTMMQMNHWGENVPIGWTKLESILRKMRESMKICGFSNLLEKVLKLEEIKINNKEDLLAALKFFHDTGVIFFRKEIENIILDVQWFVDAFKCIVMDERHFQKMEPINCTQFDSLNQHGLLSGELLHDLWKNSDFQQHEEKLVKHMVDLNMLAYVHKNLWYVPCMNKQTYTPSILDNCTVSSTLCFVFEFLPFVIFYRLVIDCINNMGMTLWQHGGKYCIYHTVVVLKWKDMKQVLIGIRDNKANGSEIYPYSIEIQAVVTQPRLLDNRSCSVLRENISKILKNLTETLHEEPYLEGYRCVIKPYNELPDGKIVLKKDMSKDADCTNCVPGHVIDVKSILGFWEKKQKSRSTKTSTSTKNEKTVKTTVKEETTIYPDGRKEVKKTTTVDEDGNISEEVSTSVSQGQPLPSGGSGTSVASKPANDSKGNQTLDECNQEDALKAHNELRAKHGVPPVTLAKDLQDYAQKWAEHMASKGDFDHSNCELNGQSIGENIAYTESSRPTDYAGKDFTQYWYSEIKDHNFGKDHQPGTGHFTQVVWKGTKEVGFGKAKSVDGCKVYVCGSYRPAGNMLGDFKNNVFPPK